MASSASSAPSRSSFAFSATREIETALMVIRIGIELGAERRDVTGIGAFPRKIERWHAHSRRRRFSLGRRNQRQGLLGTGQDPRT